MKLFLTSGGLYNKKIEKRFLEILPRSPEKLKILFIPTASRTKEELFWVKKSEKQLLKIGIKKDNIFEYNLEIKDKSFFKIFDIIYVCGGNTFYLMKRLKETNFDRVILELMKEEKIYFGVSAGSIIVGKDIKIAIIGDKNDVNLKKFSGLKLTDFVLSPHYNLKERKKIIEKIIRKNGLKNILTITNEQAVYINKNLIEII
jgi:dipeptidase E